MQSVRRIRISKAPLESGVRTVLKHTPRPSRDAALTQRAQRVRDELQIRKDELIDTLQAKLNEPGPELKAEDFVIRCHRCEAVVLGMVVLHDKNGRPLCRPHGLADMRTNEGRAR